MQLVCPSLKSQSALLRSGTCSKSSNRHEPSQEQRERYRVKAQHFISRASIFVAHRRFVRCTGDLRWRYSCTSKQAINGTQYKLIMAPSMMESIVMRKCDVPLKKARIIIKEAKENIELKRACLWSKEWEQECLRINQSEKAPLEKEKTRKAHEEASASRLQLSQNVRPVPYSRGRTPCDDETQHSRHRSMSRDGNGETDRHHSISNSERHRMKSGPSSRQHVDAMIGMNVGVDITDQVHGQKERKKERSTSSSSKMSPDESMEHLDSSEKRHHRHLRSKASSDLDDRASARRSKAHSQLLSRRSPTLHGEVERNSETSGKRRDASRSRRCHDSDSADETCQHDMHPRSVSRHRGTNELRSRHEEELSHATMKTAVSRTCPEVPRGEPTSEQMLLHDRGTKERQRSKSRQRETEPTDDRSRSTLSRGEIPDKSVLHPGGRDRDRSLGRTRSKSRSTSRNRNGHADESRERSRSKSRQGSPDRSVQSTRSRERQRPSHDSDADHSVRSSEPPSRQRKEDQPTDCLSQLEKLKPLLQRRTSSSDDDDDDDISMDFEGLASRTSISSAESRNILAHHLESLSESTGDMNKSRASVGSSKSGNSAGKTRMIPVVRNSSSSSSVLRGKVQASSTSNAPKTMSRLKSPSLGASEPSKSSLRNGRYTNANKISLKLLDLHQQDSCNDFDHPEHDGKTLTSRTVSTVSTSSSDDWVDFF